MDYTAMPEVGQKIREIRTQRGLSLEDAAKLTGVSKAMLGQIERNDSIPTISVLWKVASGLRITLSDLLNQDREELTPIDITQLEPVLEADDKMKLYTVFPFSPAVGFEYFYITIEPKGEHLSNTHANATEEFVVVTKGKLNILTAGKIFTLTAPAALKFQPDKDHVYANPFDEEVVFQNIVKY